MHNDNSTPSIESIAGVETMLEGINDVATLRSSLQALKSIHIDQFEPPFFHYIEALAIRTESTRVGATEGLLHRAREALRGYLARFDEARTQARQDLAQIEVDFPTHFEQADALVKDCAFRQLRQMLDTLVRRRQPDALTRLTADLHGQAIPRPLVNNARAADSTQADPLQSNLDLFRVNEPGMPAVAELKSLGKFRESWAMRSNQKRVGRAITERRTDSGPLNSERLTIESLAVLRELSPAYLNRFVGYTDTLLWLQRATEKTPIKKG